MPFDPGCESNFRESARGKCDHHRIDLLFVSHYFPAVLLEKEVHQDKGNSFVAIHEGMVPGKVKPVCSRLLEERLVHKLAAERDPRLCQSGLEKASIPEAGQTSITLKEVCVNHKNHIAGDEVNGHYFARAFSAFLYLRFVRS